MNKDTGQGTSKYVPLYLHWLWDRHRTYAEDFLERTKAKEFPNPKELKGRCKRSTSEKAKPYETVTDTDNWLNPYNETFIPFVGRDKEIELLTENPDTERYSSTDWLSPLNEDIIPFVGREDELASLNAFIRREENQPGDFKVWAMVGPSGAGKTRLLYHWAKESIFGQGWQYISIRRDIRNMDFAALIDIEQPVLVTVDYIYGYDDVIQNIIDTFKDAKLDHPVRLLLLDHAIVDNMADLIKAPGSVFSDGEADDIGRLGKQIFWQQAPLKLEVTEGKDEFLKEIIRVVSKKDKGDPVLDQAMDYLNSLTGARQPLFAALVGDAVKEKGVPKFANRRDLIKQFLTGKTRRTWQLDDSESPWRRGSWAACFIAAATARRGVHSSYDAFVEAIPPAAPPFDMLDMTAFRTLCDGVISNDPKSGALKAFEPDIMGETHFLLCLEATGGDLFAFKKALYALISAGKGGIADEAAKEFVAFILRMGRNLSNDNQDDAGTKRFWESLQAFLKPDSFDESSPFRWAVAMSCCELSEVLKEKQQTETAHLFLEKVVADDLYALPENHMTPRYIWHAIRYFDTCESQSSGIPAQLKRLLKIWDDGENREYTALMLALSAESASVASDLIEQDAHLKAVDKDGVTALMLACRYDHEAIALRLIEKDANLEAQNGSGKTALMFALSYSQEAVVLRLIEKDANLEAQDEDGMTALMLACLYHQEAVALRLIEKNANLEAQNVNGKTALMLACFFILQATALRLIEKSVNLEAQDEDGRTALMMACRFDQEVTALRLIEKGANLEAQDEDGMTALMLACSFGQEATALRLIEKGANLEAQDEAGMTALMIACRDGHESVVQCLIDAKANLEAQNKDKSTALMVAIQLKKEAVALKLIVNDAQLDTVNGIGSSLLICACVNGLKKVALEIAKKDPIPEHHNNIGQTGLMAAATNGLKDVVRELLRRQVPTDDIWTTDDGMQLTALGLARDAGHTEIIEMLEAAGALELPPYTLS